MKPYMLAAALLLPLTLGACVIHVGPDDEDGHYVHKGSVQRQEMRNRDAISRLELGSAFDQVRSQLGEPDFAEASVVGGHEIRILRYRTHRTSADGDTTRDETTPLVFKDGKLVGIGERAVVAETAE
jgi:hypothetical protein